MAGGRNIRRSGATWLAASTYSDAPVSEEILTGGYRPVNLQASPFLFPAPEIIFQEGGDPNIRAPSNKYLGVWRISDLPRI